jgi:hypothetical protein
MGWLKEMLKRTSAFLMMMQVLSDQLTNGSAEPSFRSPPSDQSKRTHGGETKWDALQ